MAGKIRCIKCEGRGYLDADTDCGECKGMGEIAGPKNAWFEVQAAAFKTMPAPSFVPKRPITKRQLVSNDKITRFLRKRGAKRFPWWKSAKRVTRSSI